MKMVTCAVVGCVNNSARNKHVSYHKLPSETRHSAQRTAWLERLSNGNPNDKRTFVLHKNCYVCSDHFGEEDYEFKVNFKLMHLPNQKTNRILKEDAVPWKNLDLKKRRKPFGKKSEMLVETIEIKIEPFGQNMEDFAVGTDSMEWGNPHKTKPIEVKMECFDGSTIKDEHNEIHQPSPTCERSPKRPKIQDHQYSHYLFGEGQELGTAFYCESTEDRENGAILDMTSFSGPDPVKLEEPDDYQPPSPVCRISEDVGTQCELGSESYQNTVKTCKNTSRKQLRITKEAHIRLKKLSDLVGELKNNSQPPNLRISFEKFSVESGVQCKISRETN